MPTARKIATATKPATPAKPAKPATRVIAVAKPAKPVAAIVAAKPVIPPATTAKPAAVPAKPAKPAPDKTAAAIERQQHRDAQYLARASYPAGTFTAVNAAYLGLFASFAKADKAGIFDVSAVTLSGAKPAGITIVNNRARARLLHLSGHLEPVAGRVGCYTIAQPARTLAVYTAAIARTA